MGAKFKIILYIKFFQKYPSKFHIMIEVFFNCVKKFNGILACVRPKIARKKIDENFNFREYIAIHKYNRLCCIRPRTYEQADHFRNEIKIYTIYTSIN